MSDVTQADKLEEAVAPAAFLERVKKLEQGEVARLEGGIAVKRKALEDGRDAFSISASRSWRREQTGDVDWYDADTVRTADDAVKKAFEASAASSDPDSIGGATSIRSWRDLLHNGAIVRVRAFTTDGQVIVTPPDDPQDMRTISPSVLSLPAPKFPWLVEEEAAAVMPGAVLRERRGRPVHDDEGVETSLMEATLDLLEADGLYDSTDPLSWSSLEESAKTATLVATPAPIGKGKGKVEYPPYFQNVRNAIMKTGKTVAEASSIAWSRLRAWAKGGSGVGKEVQAAAAAALKALEAQGAKHAVKESDEGPFWLGEVLR